MAMANINLIGVFVTKLWPKLWPVQAVCDGGGEDGGGATKNITSPKFSNFGDIIRPLSIYTVLPTGQSMRRFSYMHTGLPYLVDLPIQAGMLDT